MRYKDFEKLLNPQVDFSRNNVSGSIIFILIGLCLFLSTFLYQEIQTNKDISELRGIISVEYQAHQHYKEIAKMQRRSLKRLRAERTQIVDISFYTRSKRETDNTPNQTAIMTYAQPNFTVACSHDLKWMLGHYIYITGRGVFYVEDLMNSRYTKRLDILVNSKKDIPADGVLNKQEVIVLGKELELYYE